MKYIILFAFILCNISQAKAQRATSDSESKKQILQLFDEIKVHLTVWVQEPEDVAKMKKAKTFFDELAINSDVTLEDLRMHIVNSNHKGITEALFAFKAGKITIDEAEATIKNFSCAREITVGKVIYQLESLYLGTINIVNTLDSKEKYEDVTTSLLCEYYLQYELPESIENIKKLLDEI